MNRLFSFFGRTIERLTGKKFFATCAYMIIEAYLRLNGIPFEPEALVGLLTYVAGQTVADLKPEKINKVLPIALACTSIMFYEVAKFTNC